ncbi:MAG: CPBP family intramembrane glutamic endopeptidase [Lutibacter sp.]
MRKFYNLNFVQQAYKGINEWWAYLVTLILFFIGWQIIGVIPLTAVAYFKAGSMGRFINAAQDNFTSLGINSNVYLLLIICTFLFGLLFLFLGVKVIHKRPLKTLISSREKIDWNRFFYSFFVWSIIGIVMLAVSYIINPSDFVWNFKPKPFFILVLISVFLLPIQTSMEEIVFRGYLMQGFGTWFKKLWVPLLLTSVIFGLLHGLNPEVKKLGYISMVYYIGTGLVLGIIALMDEGIELTLGFHAANNITAAVFVTANWTVFQTDALFVDVSEPSVGVEMFIPIFVLYPILLYWFSKKYHWKNWREKLTGTVRKPLLLNEDEFIAE